MDTKIVTRFAPSPTGFLHVGGIRTALFNYLFARKHGGTFILRIEDTDKERSTKAFEDNILDALTWLGLEWDALYRQSERTQLYTSHLQRLIDSGAAYVSKETPKEAGDRDEVIRFKNPNSIVSWDDLILGTVSVDTTDLGDFVIAKDLETPLYHLAVVVDDNDMGITHVIRGQEHVSNTPRQLLLQAALDFTRPQYAHIPLILAPDKTKLSKRHGAVSATEYREQGYLPEALLNFMSFIGWNPGGEKELFTKEELIAAFSLERVQKSPGVFNVEKLQWLNREHVKRLPTDTLRARIIERIPERIRVMQQWSTERFDSIVPSIIERIATFADVTTLVETGDLDYFFDAPAPTVELLKTTEHLPHVVELLSKLSETSFMAESIKAATWDFATEKGRGVVLWPMRIALTGKEKSPDPFTVAAILGKMETLSRLHHAISLS